MGGSDPRVGMLRSLHCHSQGVRSSIFQPVCDELWTLMNIDLSQRSIASIDKFVWRLWRNNNDLSRLRCKRLRANGKRDASLLHHKDLLIGMLMQPHTLAREHINPDKRDAGLPIQVSLKFMHVAIKRQVIPAH